MMERFPRARWVALAMVLGVSFVSGGWLMRPAPSAEGGIYQQWETAKQSWVNRGTVIDLGGKSKNCKFDQSTGVCQLY